MQRDLSDRELDEVMAMLQDNPHWHAGRLIPLMPALVAEVCRRRGKVGPTANKDNRNTYQSRDNRGYVKR